MDANQLYDAIRDLEERYEFKFHRDQWTDFKFDDVACVVCGKTSGLFLKLEKTWIVHCESCGCFIDSGTNELGKIKERGFIVK